MAAGLDKVAAEIAAIKDAPIPKFELLSCTSGFPSMEHLTLPTLVIAGNPIKS
ncbi:hypothetical protein A2U01_0117814, partial [Trifolium medium]|nr:hypothetical protein [Trifolium medium]